MYFTQTQYQALYHSELKHNNTGIYALAELRVDTYSSKDSL